MINVSIHRISDLCKLANALQNLFVYANKNVCTMYAHTYEMLRVKIINGIGKQKLSPSIPHIPNHTFQHTHKYSSSYNETGMGKKAERKSYRRKYRNLSNEAIRASRLHTPKIMSYFFRT